MSVAPSLSSLSNPTSNSSSESLMKNKNKDAMTSSFVVLPPRMKKSTNSKKSTTTSSSTTTPTTTNTNTNTNTRMNSGLTAELLKNTPGNKMDLTSSFVIASQDDYEFVSSNPTSSFASLTASAVSTLPNSAVVSPAPSSIASSTSSYFFAALEKHNAGNKLTSSASSRPSSIMSFEAPPAKYRPGRTISRRAQRLANLCFLLDGEVDEKDFTYLEAPQQTQFAWLLEDEQRLQKWLDFVSQPEEKQKQILFGKEKDTSSKIPPTVHIFPTADSSQCYLRIERRVREMLRKANIPKGVLSNMEAELVDSFSKSPNKTLVLTLDNSFTRLLAHALCQYYGLRSASEDVQGCRKTFINNQFDTFITPDTPLSKLLGL